MTIVAVVPIAFANRCLPQLGVAFVDLTSLPTTGRTIVEGDLGRVSRRWRAARDQPCRVARKPREEMGQIVVPVKGTQASSFGDGGSETLELELRRLALRLLPWRAVDPRPLQPHGRWYAMLAATASSRLSAVMQVRSSVPFSSLPVRPGEQLTNASEPMTASKLDIT